MAEDEAVRDLKKSFQRNDKEGKQSMRSSSSMPDLSSEPLHPDIGRFRDIAQPGGFRREHIIRTTEGHSVAVREPLLQTLMDPRALLYFIPPPEVEDDCVSLPPSGSSNLATVLVIIKSTIGGTMIVLPGGFRHTGILAASGLLVFIGGISIYCMVLLVRCSQALGPGASYAEISRAAAGRKGYAAVSISLVISQLGFVCAEMLYVAENFHGIWTHIHGTSPVVRPVGSVTSLLFLQLVVTIPMAWIRKLKYFQGSNLIANTLVFLALAYLASSAVTGIAEHGIGNDIQLIGPHWTLFAGTAVFCFECINFVIPIYDAHEDKRTFPGILTATLGGVIVLLVFFGSICYLRYGDITKPVVTLNLSPHDPVVAAIPLAFALSSLLNVPLFLFPATTFIEEKIFAPGPPTRRRKWAKNGIRAALLLLCTVFSFVGADNLMIVISFIGAFCCVPLALIYPVIFHIRICKPGYAAAALECGIGIIGAVIFVITTWQAAVSVLSPHRHPHPHPHPH